MRNKDYWAERMRALEDEQYQRSKEYFGDLQKQFDQASKSLQADIERWYYRLAENNEISYTEAKKLLKARELDEFKWTVEQYIRAGEENELDQRWMKQLENASARYHIDRLEAMKLQVQQHAEMLFKEYEKGMTDYLRKDCAESFYRTAYEISKGTGVGFNLAKLDTRKIDALIKRPWAQDGKVFSDRIWTNKEKLISNLHTELTQCIIRGDAPRTAIDRLAKKMKVSKEQAGTLVMTESAAIASATQKECFRELDVERFQFDATLDGSTCEICQSMDQKLFKMSQFEIGVTAPPIHPKCRCCTVPGFDDWDKFEVNLERAARDSDTGDTVYVDGSLKYEDWKREIDRDNHLADSNIITKIRNKANDHAPIGIDDLPEAHVKSIYGIINNAPQPVKDFTLRSIDRVKIINENYIGIANCTKRGIRFSLKKQRSDPRGRYNTLFHEMGHKLDEINGDISVLHFFKSALESDFENIVKSYSKLYNIGRRETFVEISNVLKAEPRRYHSVSDLCGALSGNQCAGYYTHKLTYWKNTPDALEKEAFAHFYEATIRDDAEKLSAITQMFPTAYKIFEDMLR